ncbi:MAG: hypothetical protein JF599_01800 [Verrucomicrobia bacterium]|nr:hypothetical protein [Verrucomicrobiota bacterium]
MKKTTPKAAKATPVAKKTPAKAVKKVAPSVVKKKAAAPAVKASAKPVVTLITANVDVGFGNALFIRGEGPGLSWDLGVPLNCLSDTQWSIKLPETSKPVVYKFLINDVTWSTGVDYVTEPGTKALLSPSF